MSDQQQSTTQAFPSSDQQQSSTQAFVKKTAAQRKLYESGNELAAYAAKQINYHIMGYYPITPSTQIAENLDLSGARGEHNIRLIAAEGEHSAAGICYGASAGGGRVFNATSANGLLYACLLYTSWTLKAQRQSCLHRTLPSIFQVYLISVSCFSLLFCRIKSKIS